MGLADGRRVTGSRFRTGRQEAGQQVDSGVVQGGAG